MVERAVFLSTFSDVVLSVWTVVVPTVLCPCFVSMIGAPIDSVSRFVLMVTIMG